MVIGGALLALALQARAQERTGDVVYVPTPANVIAAMFEMTGIAAGDFVIDLGSGDGRIVIEAAKQKGARGVGVELDSSLVNTARGAAKREGVAERVTFVEGNLFDVDIRKASVLTLYLLPHINAQLRPRILHDLRPGTRVVSHDFDMGAWKPDAQRELPVPNKSYGPPRSQVYLWYVPANLAGTWQWRLPVDGTVRLYEARMRQRFQEVNAEALIDGSTATGHGVALRGDLIAFELSRAIAGRTVRHEFSGRVAGDRISGRVRIGGAGGETLAWEASRTERAAMSIE